MAISAVAITGAGIAGLTTALCLARHGIESHIVEQSPVLSEVGAGLQISPNASAVLDSIGVLTELERHWSEPERIVLASGLTLKKLAAIPAGAFARSRWKAPYGVLHRFTLQHALLAAVEAEPLCHLHLGARMEEPTLAALAAVTGRKGELLIGADGVWSRTRATIGGARARFSGNSAWRFILPRTALPGFLDPKAVTAYLAPRSHLVCYPLSDGDGFNMVAVAAGMRAEGWSSDGESAALRELQAQFADWHPEARAALAMPRQAAFWPLFEVEDGPWSNGRDTLLIGDAAHAMMPFAAQGAAMAIEDAHAIARFAAAAADAPQAIARYEAERRPRIRQLRKRGDFNRFAYHARGPFRIGRDLILSLRSGESLARSLDDIFGYRAEGL